MFTVAALFAGFVSRVEVVSVPVSEMMVPDAVPAFTLTVTMNVLVEPRRYAGIRATCSERCTSPPPTGLTRAK